jgi:hypothetical protein
VISSLIVLQSLDRLGAWIEAEQFAGWDPHDGLNSPLLRPLARGRRRVGQVLLQFVKRSPVNVRPWIRVPRQRNAKAIGLFLDTYWQRYRRDRDPLALTRVAAFIAWLQSNVCETAHGAGWGYNFDWPNRNFLAPAGTPNLVCTVFVARALLKVAREHDVGELKSRATALVRRACAFVASDLRIEQTNADELAFSYTPLDRRIVHNASVLGATLLAEAGRWFDDEQLLDAARRATRFTTSRQAPDGSWPYGEDANDRWIDSFHTGYILVALKDLSSTLPELDLGDATRQGYAYWRRTMAPGGGVAYYHPHQPLPVDSHCSAQAILTLLAYQHDDDGALVEAWSVADRLVSTMQDPSGFFYYQRYRWFCIRTAYMRWVQAWVQRSLSELVWSTPNESPD